LNELFITIWLFDRLLMAVLNKSQLELVTEVEIDKMHFI
jgi:hypothetical protein